jgi:hypothetical protein
MSSLAIAFPLTLLLGLPIAAIAAPVLPRLLSGCRGNLCWTDRFNQRNPSDHGGASRLSQMPDATFYKLSLETEWTKPTPLTSQRSYWVYCSKTRPSVAVELPKQLDLEQAVTVHRFNPGGTPSSDNAALYPIYWGVCHDQWSPSPSSPALDYRSLGQQWGYTADLPSSEKRIPRGLWKF